MTGFEVDINAEKTRAFVEGGVLALSITSYFIEKEQFIELDLGGTSANEAGDKLKEVKWNKCDLKTGDEVTVQVKDIRECSSPIEEKLVDVPQTPDPSHKLEEYLKLKKKLEKVGVL